MKILPENSFSEVKSNTTVKYKAKHQDHRLRKVGSRMHLGFKVIFHIDKSSPWVSINFTGKWKFEYDTDKT